ncbi:hypothetical protein GH5_07264 [Leishmania sp. Ghana 2012 LV757]|uniref:hypothetical protein n=1 Tax=Leishmania sp. Ghana 2012 LV757 TaxID=2803181 RepID=UPI001B46A695|nr:hypothetical protein GH5_07264 [Leishmania sp. Ghana 2012 LV757]
MPSRRKSHKRGDPHAPPPESEGHQQQPKSSSAEDAPTLDLQSTTVAAQQPSLVYSGADDDDDTASVLADAEDSYRLVIEHDEHLARIRAYTDFYDKLACVKAEADGLSRDRDAQPRRPFEVFPLSKALRVLDVPPTAPAPPTLSQQQQSTALGSHPSPASLERTLADLGHAAPGNESRLATPCVSMVRNALQPRYAGSHDASATLSPKVADAKQVSRLQAENARMAVELQASQEVVQQLHHSLLEAREALLRCFRIEGVNDDPAGEVTSDGQQHPFSAATSAGEAEAQEDAPIQPPLASCNPVPSPLSISTSPVPGSAPNSSTAEPPPQSDKLRQHEWLQAPSSPSPPPKALLLGSQSRLDSFGISDPSPHSSSALFDVAEFFWVLQVAPPPPSTVHDGSGYNDHCHVPAASLCSPLGAAGEGTQTGGTYGATTRGVTRLSSASAEQWASPQVSRYHPRDWHHQRQRPHAGTEEAVLACESAWMSSNYYCYSIMDEIPSLRVVPATDEGTEGIGPAVPALNDDRETRQPFSHISVAALPPSVPSHENSTPLSSPTRHSTPAATSPWPVFEGASASLRSRSSPGCAVMLAGGLSSPTARFYRVQYLQRLWVTSVLRHLLLFLLVTLTCVLLFIPNAVLGTVNLFEAANGHDLYALRNRFGHSALLAMARLDACALIFLSFFGVVGGVGGWQQQQQHQQQSSTSPNAQHGDGEKTAAVEVPSPGSAAPTTTTTETPWRGIFYAKSAGALVHLILCAGAGLVLFGCVVLREGCRGANLSLALLGELCYGAGEALLLGGLGTIVSAEVGVTAGVSVSMQILLLAWLIVNAFSSFVFPKLSHYVYIAAGMVDALVYVTVFIGALAFSVLMLSPRDLIDRAVRAHAKDITPRKLWSAARHDVSFGFVLRALTAGLLTAAVVLLMSCGFAVFVPTQAVVMAVAKSIKSRELMGNSTDTGTAATDSLPIYQDRWITHQRRAPVLLFTYALVAMPICFIPRLAFLVNRWCSVPLLTTLLCAMWVISTGASWAPVLGLDASASSSGSKGRETSSVLPAVLSWCSSIWLRLVKQHFPAPSVDACAAATGVIYIVVVSSLLRSIANAGVPLPVMPPHQWRTAFEERGHKAASAAAAARFPSEATPLLAGGARKGKFGHADAPAATAESPDTAIPPDAGATRATKVATDLARVEWETHSVHPQRRVQVQLRGGPADITMLVCILIMMVLLACVTVMTAAAVLLTSRDESPVYVNRLVPGVTLDEHLIVKSTLACVLITAMLVQWVEVSRRFCRRRV